MLSEFYLLFCKGIYVFYLLIGLLLLIIFYFFFYKKKTIESKAVEKEVDATESATKNLLILNLSIREKALETELLHLVEKLIDDLRRILPRLNSDFKTSEMAWVINSMANKYLPNILNPYLSLNESAKHEQKSKLEESIASMDKELSEVETMLDSSDTSSFESKARFIKHRFQ